MTTWITPKTDWESSWDNDGNYTGDYFNIGDWARITNNMTVLQEMALELFAADISRTYATKTYSDYYYASDVNALERTLDDLYDDVYALSIGTNGTYYGNQAFPDYVEWNRIESAQLTYYNMFNAVKSGLLRLSFRLGAEPFGNRF